MSQDTNTGDYNSGNRNSGDYNSGDRNSGNRNSGNYNSGNRNSGDYNSGDRNSGDYNSGNYNSGAFNRDEPKMRLFEQELDMTVSEFYQQYSLYIKLPVCAWVNSSDMTAEEKKQAPSHTTTGGFLRTLGYKEAWAKWWSENPDHDRFLKLPGFNAEIFKDITGIDVETKATIDIGGKKYEVTSELTKALKNLKEAA